MTIILEKPRLTIDWLQRTIKDTTAEIGAAHEAVVREQTRIAVLEAALAEYESDLSILRPKE